jgi:alpha/beta superfamily hydrolase
MSDDLPQPGQSRDVLIQGAAGHIEALIAAPRADVKNAGFAVICHPHPLFGGALSNKVTYTLAATALKAGFFAARFNFRGVGKSQGLHDDGRGETDDTVTVVEWMRERQPDAPLLLMGFSFGAFVSIQAAARARPSLQVSIAPPFSKYFDKAPLPPRPPCPWLVVQGRDDDVVDFSDTQARLAHYQPPPEVVSFDGVGHFFHGRLGDLQNAVTEFITRHLRRS